MPLFAETDIYKFEVPMHDGEICCDPMKIRRDLLTATSGRCWEYADTARKIENSLTLFPEADVSEKAVASRAELSLRLAEMEGKLADAGMVVFGLEPVDQQGVGHTETLALRLVKDYLAWVSEKKEAAGKSPTS
jgi:hypothetical protein